MATPNDTPASKEPQMAGCQQEPCSPSSITPETREEWRRLQRLPDGSYSSQVTYGDLAHGMSAFAKKMEIERDEARALCRKFGVRLRAITHDLEITGTAEMVEAEMDAHPEIFPENVKAQAQMGRGGTSLL